MFELDTSIGFSSPENPCEYVKVRCCNPYKGYYLLRGNNTGSMLSQQRIERLVGRSRLESGGPLPPKSPFPVGAGGLFLILTFLLCLKALPRRGRGTLNGEMVLCSWGCALRAYPRLKSCTLSACSQWGQTGS